MIAVLTPTRERPDRFKEMVDAIEETSEGRVIVLAYLDRDDPELKEYRQILQRWEMTPGRRVKVGFTIGPRVGLAASCNSLAGAALNTPAEYLAFFGDDHRPRTHAWDARIALEMHAMGGGLVYCADGLQNERLPTAPIWSSDVILAMGFYYPPVLKHLFADDYWLRLARDLGRCCYVRDVMIEHLHPSAGKAEEDQSYRESAQHWDEDQAAFELFLEEEHPAILERVRGELGL